LGWDLRRQIKRYVGIDRDVSEMRVGNLKFVRAVAETMLKKVEKNTADYVVSLAVIEHVSDAELFLTNCKKILKRGGVVVLTSPQPWAALVLDILARTRLINEDEIDEHERYFDSPTLKGLMRKVGFVDVGSKKFLFGFNCRYTGKKP
jgi:2-polyprenyl-3-methyl-5-hydroxy-6-metoxy-1,4-benzoquinol methylase